MFVIDPTARINSYAAGRQPPSFKTRFDEAGYFANKCLGRIGRSVKLPPQLGHVPARTSLAQSGQNVHSKLQMNASASGGRSLSQHSQFGRSSSMTCSGGSPLC